jgi:hypothetical protein
MGGAVLGAPVLGLSGVRLSQPHTNIAAQTATTQLRLMGEW